MWCLGRLTQEESLEILRIREHILDNLPVAVTSMYFLLSLDLADGLLILQLNVRVIGRQTSKFAEVAEATLSLADTDQVARRLEQERDHDAHASCGNELDGHGCLPLRGSVCDVGAVPEGDAIVDPESEHEGDDDA